MKEAVINKDEETPIVIPSVTQGLSLKQVEEYRQKGLTNEEGISPSKSVREIIIDNICTYFNLIFLIITILLVIVNAWRDLTFLPIIIANTFIGIFQEISAKKTLDQLTLINMPKVAVVRGGEEIIIETRDLVLNDVMILRAGNQICADAQVIAGQVQVNESLITGEADEIAKQVGDKLLSGSFIISGKCYALLQKVGKDAYVARLTAEAKALKVGEQSEMIRSLNWIVKAVGVMIIPISLILFYQHHFILGGNFKESITSAVAAVIGMIPEGLYLLTSVALAVGVRRLAKKRVLVHDMKCIETLARVDVLCVDKTGTITENEMTVKGVKPIVKEYSEKEIHLLLGDFVSAMDQDNITMAALAKTFTKGQGRKVIKSTSFSATFKYSGVTFEEGAYVLGAPEYILRERYEDYKGDVEAVSSQGYRVLLLAQYKGEIDGKSLTGEVKPLAFILLINAIRKEARKTFEYFYEQQVEVKVISGDNPLTVSEVAKVAGIQGAEHYIDGTTLKTKEQLQEALTNYTVFGRVTPAQKRQLIRGLKGLGHTVAMTGDGVNDVLALKDADCSIAMASGSEAACQVAQVVLLSSDFSCMPWVVREGRRVVNNMERSASLFLVKNSFSLLLSLFAILFLVDYPLKPSQISLISMFTIGIPAFFLALEENHHRIEGKFIYNVLYKALPAGLTDFIIVSTLMMFGRVFQVEKQDISTASVILLAIVGFMILYKISQPMNKWRWMIFFSMVGGVFFCGFFMSELFAITQISFKCSLLLILFAVASASVFRYVSFFFTQLRQIKRHFNHLHHQRKRKK